MEHKSWRWRRRSAETTVIENARASFSLESNVEEVRQFHLFFFSNFLKYLRML